MKVSIALVAALAVSFSSLVSTAPAGDLVTGIPGMNDTFSYPVYSGFLNLTDTKRIYYLFEGALNDTDNDKPIIMWSNGGPGCSSLLGWLTEIGHYQIGDDDKFYENPHSWNAFANVLYFDHPAPVGFSTCDGSSASTECHASDTSDGADNLVALKMWMDAFPEYKTRPLWLAGESYAGIYMPTLLNEIDLWNTNTAVPEADQINVKGMMIGNGVTNWTWDTQPATFNMTYWHALMGQEMWDDLEANQCDFSMINFGTIPGPACLALYDRFMNITSKINMYKIFDPFMRAPALTKKKQVKSYTSGDQILEITDEIDEEVRGFSQRHYTPWMVSPNHKDSPHYYSAL